MKTGVSMGNIIVTKKGIAKRNDKQFNKLKAEYEANPDKVIKRLKKKYKIED